MLLMLSVCPPDKQQYDLRLPSSVSIFVQVILWLSLLLQSTNATQCIYRHVRPPHSEVKNKLQLHLTLTHQIQLSLLLLCTVCDNGLDRAHGYIGF